ncbi:MFS transporter [Pararoseomonas sp. SCSIO 73927]|uniref:CynX/NimT family MFS transporter n=1 Tax=Pararoseomonas sp. SCSIO 73927 TaxID=3114537 RepID=UPI0030CB5E05
MVLLAANLRPALTGVGPLVEQIRQATGLSLTEAGLLNSLPLLALGAFAPLAHLGRRLGMERTLVAALLLLCAGLLIRSHGSVEALFVGSACLAAGIAIGNVLVPGIIKRDFPDRVRGMTTVYAITLGLTAAIASGLAVPLSALLPGGWRAALAVWAIPAAVALLVWLPPATLSASEPGTSRGSGAVSPWRSRLGWLVTAFMGLQSLMFYVTVAWFPTILQGNGFSPAEAGLLMTLFQLVGLAVSAMMPALLRRAKDQTRYASAGSAAMAVSVVGILVLPQAAYLWLTIMGLGGGACLTLALAFISLRSANHHEAASLSVMSQTVGYMVAAAGPIGFGLLHDATGSWSVPLVLLAAAGLLQAFVGFGAGQDRTLAARPQS